MRKEIWGGGHEFRRPFEFLLNFANVSVDIFKS